MTEPSRTAVAVALLVDDADARRLVLAWPLLDRALRDVALVASWAATAGVPRSRVQRLARVLLQHRLCREDGSVDPEALRVVQHVAAETLKAAGQRRKP